MKRIISSAMLAIMAAAAFAAEISRDQAAIAAENWLRQSPNPMNSGLPAIQAAKVDTVADDDGQPLFHAVRMSGGGTVITSSDTGVEPVIAFGPENMDVTPGSPLHALLVGDMRARRAALEAAPEEEASTAKSGRARLGASAASEEAASADDEETPEEKWARLLAEDESAQLPNAKANGRLRAASVSWVDPPTTINVHPLTGTKWNQGGASNAADRVKFDLFGNHRSPFSYYTPSFYPAGCVPVALAQILAYYNTFDISEENRTKLWTISENGKREVYSLEWPETQHRQFLPFRCVELFPEQLSFNSYTWNFEDQPNVGGLIASCGALLGADYTVKETSASIADFPSILKGIFHYNGATFKNEPSTSVVVSTIKTETDKGRIVCLGLRGPAIADAGGKTKPTHAVIADGYGKTGSTTYVHLNMGWGGQGDVWYNLPKVEPPDSVYKFNVIHGMVYDMRPGLDMSELGIPIPGVTGIDDMDQICDGFPTYGFSKFGVLVEWRPYATGKTYTIKRGLRDGTYAQRQGVEIKNHVSGTDFVDETAQRGVRYLYTIEMENPSSMFDMSPDCHLTGYAHVLPPENVNAVNLADNNGVLVSWDAADGADSYDIFRWGPALTKDDIGNMVTNTRPRWIKGHNGGSGNLSVTDGDAARTGDHYAYTVFSYNTYAGLSETGAIVFVESSTILPDLSGTPTLTGSGDASTGDVTLNWSKTGSGDSYLYSNSSCSNVGDANSKSFKQKRGTTVIYRIQSSGKSGGRTIYSPLSKPVVISVLPEVPSFTISDTSDPRSGFEHRRGKKITVSNAYYNFRYRVWRIQNPTDVPHLVGVFEKNEGKMYGSTYQHSVCDWHIDPEQTYYWYVDIEGVEFPSGKPTPKPGRIDGDPTPWPGNVTLSTVTLDQQGGADGTESVTVANGFPMPAIAIPTKQGFDFVGYFTEPEGVGDQYYTASGTSARNWPYEHGGTLYAAWTKKTVPLSSIAISGPATVASAGTATYTCTATYSDKSTATVAAEWSLTAGTAYGSIDPATGFFTALSAPAQRTVTVKAVFGGKSATKTVTISARTLWSLAISGPDEIPSLETAAYTCTATYGDGTTEAISPTWSIAAGGTYATVVKTTGAVTSKNEGETDQTATLRATSGGKTADKSIMLLAKEPPRPEGDLHVDAEKGDDANDGRTWHRAKKTIQGAIDVAVDGDLVFVFDGLYGPIDTMGLAVEIQSVNGAEATIIDGGGASRCATLGPDTMLSGFTLENGSADNGGGVSNGIVRLCILRGNTAADNGGGACESRLENCLITGNSATNGGGAFEGFLVNCTVSGNSSVYGAVYGGSVIGSIVYDNTVQAESDGMISVPQAICKRTCAQESFKNDLYLGTSLAERLFLALGNITANPCFADAANGDYRLLPESPCIDGGNTSTVDWDVDLDGAVRVQNGAVDMGAYECHPPWRVTFNVRGNGLHGDGAVTGAPKDGNYYVLPTAIPTREGYVFKGWTLADGTPVESLSDLPGGTRAVILYADWAAVYTIKFIAAEKRFIDENPEEEFSGEMDDLVCVAGEPVTLPACAFTRRGYACIGWSERGEDVLYMNGETVPSFTRIPGAVVTLYADWCDTAITTFADPVGGHVVGAGARVYSSLQAAIDAAPDGGTVFAFPGTYGPINAEGRRGLSIYSAFAPDVARSESDLSVIDGRGSSPCAVFDVATGDGNVMLCGFHLTGGSGYDGGGAVGGILYNCLITDCEADEHGGGAYDSILENCCVSSCRAYASGGGAAFCDMYSTVIDGCSAAYYGGGAAICHIYGSTIYGNSAEAGAGVAGSTVYNSIVWENRLYAVDKKGVRKLGNYANVGSGKTATKNSFLYSDSSPKPSGKGNLAKDPLFVDAAQGDFRLQTASPVKNKGSAAYLNGWNWDVRRLPRILGAAHDMGAFETPEGTLVPADYDGDGVADAAYFDSATANWVMMRSRDGLVSVNFGSPKDIPLAAYFDGDHRADMAVYSATAKAPAFSVLTRSWYLFGPYSLGEKGAQPVAADFDGDGYDDLAVFQGNAKKPSFKALLSSVGDDPDDAMSVVFGIKGAKAVIGDFDGDGLADLGCYTSTASKPAFSVALSEQDWSAAAPLSITLGAKGSEPCCGDFDGDGVTDFAAYSGTAKAPLLYRMFSTSKWREVRTLPFGEKGSRAAIADWDGDGAADAAIEFHGRWWYVTRGWEVGEVPAP